MTSSLARWHEWASCANHPDLDWHSAEPGDVAACRRICQSCPVQTACLEEALAECDPWGLRGGLTPDERELIAGPERVRILPAHGTNARYAKHRCRCGVCRQAHARYARHCRNRRRLSGSQRAPQIQKRRASGDHESSVRIK
ncbi:MULTISPECIES: WhiB family transcriptional regulator [Amycolatopsis]|uniref:WhiB family transcriptional regulator n=1 Tax=Amycolatopsis albidoflavus TaxID=102226 RepID=A0ABW5I8Y7_9PSEU